MENITLVYLTVAVAFATLALYHTYKALSPREQKSLAQRHAQLLVDLESNDSETSADAFIHLACLGFIPKTTLHNSAKERNNRQHKEEYTAFLRNTKNIDFLKKVFEKSKPFEG